MRLNHINLCASVRAAAESLADPARESGELRSDLSIDQVLALVVAVANIAGDPAFRAPVLDAALGVLRPSPPTPRVSSERPGSR